MDRTETKDTRKEHVYTDKEVIKLAEREIDSLRSELQKQKELNAELVEALGDMYLSEYGGNSKTLEEAMERAPKAVEYEQHIVSIIKKSKEL